MTSRPLISADEAVRLLGEAVFLDARTGQDANQAYQASHVRGAFRADLETDLSEPGDPMNGGRHPLPTLDAWSQRLGRWGISPSTTVIVYDAAGGGMAAARAWWMLRAIRHEVVAVVDGGWQALREAGVPTDDRTPPLRPEVPYVTALDRWPTVNAALVERARVDPTWRVIDARAPDRYNGSSEPIDPVAGHIPGAHNLYWQFQLNTQASFDSAEILRDRYQRILSDVPTRNVVCYCGSGVTACHLLLAMEVCGLSGAHLYAGSWSEWCRQGRPLATS